MTRINADIYTDSLTSNDGVAINIGNRTGILYQNDGLFSVILMEFFSLNSGS